jgi:hypothetical protein
VSPKEKTGIFIALAKAEDFSGFCSEAFQFASFFIIP